jgi:hypothetical protein
MPPQFAAGGSDDGAPGPRQRYHRDYYAAFVIDPDGHRIEAVCHAPNGAGRNTTESQMITPERNSREPDDHSTRLPRAMHRGWVQEPGAHDSALCRRWRAGP